MKSADKYALVLVTAPDLKTARQLAKSALAARLIACASLIPGLESHYRWQGRLETTAEVLLVLKTARARLARLEKHILAGHPYDTPEFVVLRLDQASEKYLEWLRASCEA